MAVHVNNSNNFMIHAHFNCPACNREIETSVATARRGLRCPGCNTGFIPQGYAPEPRTVYPASAPGKMKNLALLIWPGLMLLVLGAALLKVISMELAVLIVALALLGAIVSAILAKK